MAYNVKGQPTQLSLNTTETSTVIEGLKPYTSYCIRVQGYTKIGPSAWSHCTTVMTLQSGEVNSSSSVISLKTQTTVKKKL